MPRNPTPDEAAALIDAAHADMRAGAADALLAATDLSHEGLLAAFAAMGKAIRATTAEGGDTVSVGLEIAKALVKAAAAGALMAAMAKGGG